MLQNFNLLINLIIVQRLHCSKFNKNDMLISIDQGGGATLVLLDLSSAFDTIDHAVLFDL